MSVPLALSPHFSVAICIYTCSSTLTLPLSASECSTGSVSSLQCSYLYLHLLFHSLPASVPLALSPHFSVAICIYTCSSTLTLPLSASECSTGSVSSLQCSYLYLHLLFHSYSSTLCQRVFHWLCLLTSV